MSLSNTRRLPAAILVLVLLLALFAFFEKNRLYAFVVDGYENVAYAIDPSPDRALAYGERHFDASDPADYDIDRAEFFFQLAAVKDPTLPYLFHELARIAFLKGDFSQAINDIRLQITLHGDSEPTAYYVKGLIEGYMGEYTAAAVDYAHFLQFQPKNWAAKNDEAWVLLKAKRYQGALDVTNSGLADFPENAWLLNSNATALYELGDYAQALTAVRRASVAVSRLSPADWSVAYPGNDPAIAVEGLDSFKAAVAANMHTIGLAAASSTVQLK